MSLTQHPLGSPDPADQASLVSTSTPTASVKTLRHWQSQPILRSKASIQLSPFHAQAQPYHPPVLQHQHYTNSMKAPTLDVTAVSVSNDIQNTSAPQQSGLSTPSSPPKFNASPLPLPLPLPSSLSSSSSSSSTSPSSSQSTIHATAKSQAASSELNRTQEFNLQRRCVLVDDKPHFDHPTNMKRLAKEMERVNREFRWVRNYEDPMAESFLRVALTYHHSPTVPFTSPRPSSASSSSSSSSSSSCFSSSSMSTSSSPASPYQRHISSTSSSGLSTPASSSLSSSGLWDAYVSSRHKLSYPHHYCHHHHHYSKLPLSSPPVLQRRASDLVLRQQDRRNSSTSVHSVILERSHLHHHHQQQQQYLSTNSSPSKGYFFTRWFRPSIPSTKRRQSYLTC